MADLNARDAKLVQYLNEAYGKEKQLETALPAHIAMTTRPPYKKRLQQHLTETKTHSRLLQRRIRELGGKAEVADLPGPDRLADTAGKVVAGAQRAAAAAAGPLHVMRGTGEQEKLLKNAKTEYQDEAEEIATYTALETLAEAVGDRDTAKLAKGIRREEERMASFLARLIPQLAKAVAKDEVPSQLREAGGTRRRAASRRASSSSRSRSSSSRSASSASRPKSSSAKTRPKSSSAKTRPKSSSGKTRAKNPATKSRAKSSGASSSRSRAASSGRRSSGGRSAGGRSKK